MAEILGVGTTHYPGIYMLDKDAPLFLRRTLVDEKTPARLRSPRYLRFLGAVWAVVGLILLLFHVKGLPFFP